MAREKSDRISLRIAHDDKRSLKKAATAKGLSLSSYIISVSLESAKADLERDKTILVSKEGWHRLIEIIDNSLEPTEELKRLFE